MSPSIKEEYRISTFRMRPSCSPQSQNFNLAFPFAIISARCSDGADTKRSGDELVQEYHGAALKLSTLFTAMPWHSRFLSQKLDLKTYWMLRAHYHRHSELIAKGQRKLQEKLLDESLHEENEGRSETKSFFGNIGFVAVMFGQTLSTFTRCSRGWCSALLVSVDSCSCRSSRRDGTAHSYLSHHARC